MIQLKKLFVCFIALLVLTPAITCAQTPSEESEASANTVPREDFSVRESRNGYSAGAAYRFNAEWGLDAFLGASGAGVYSYLNMPEFMPHAVIRRDGPVSVLERRLNPAIGATSIEDADGKPHSFDAVINADDSPLRGIIVLHRGAIAYEAYPGMRRTDNHVWMSNAKTLTGLLIGQLEDEGKIDVQQTVAHYLPEARGTAWENVKVIDVLNQQSGLDLEENEEAQTSDSTILRLFMAEVGVPDSSGVVVPHNEVLLGIPKLREPGVAFEYSSANTQMLGLIIEAVTGVRLAETLTERVWIPTGMDGDAVLALSPQGNAIIHGLISSRLIDMAKTGLLYTPSWDKTATKRVVSEQMIKRIQTSGNKESLLKGTMGPALAGAFGEMPLASAYQWDAVFTDGDLYKSGLNGQGIYVSPERDVVVVWVAAGYPAPILVEPFARKIAKSLK